MQRLRAENLTKTFRGKTVVDGVSIEVNRGEIVGLLGPNGAGKTTSFRMIIGLLRPERGHVYLDDLDITSWPVFRRARTGIGYLSQESSVFRGLTVEENIRAVLEVQKIPRTEQKERLGELLDLIALTPLASQRASTLSGGERRRLEITRALAASPSFMMLDEPFSGVDPKAVSEIQTTIGKLRDLGIGILITDHSVRETLEVTNRSYIIHQGRVLTFGTASELVDDPRVKEAYLGDNFYMRLGGEVRGGSTSETPPTE
ncbi:MAG TPA: LPS export ABC transporter ATP-binding protein [bacterium]|nr:LPS export ABC transporter ATP-binding protein [bacterium]